MADPGEPLPTAKILISFSNPKYGEMECELWCKEAHEICEHLLLSLPKVPSLFASTLYPKQKVVFPTNLPPKQFKPSRLGLNRRGLLLFDTGSSSLMITLGPIVYTDTMSIVGRVTGRGFHNLFRFDEAYVGEDGKLVYEIKIDQISVLDPGPFDVCGGIKVVPKAETLKPKAASHPIKTDLKLLSFADSEDEQECKVQSMHEVLDDPKYLSVPVAVTPETGTVFENPATNEETTIQENVQNGADEGKENSDDQVDTESLSSGHDATQPKPPESTPESVVESQIHTFLSTRPRSQLGKRRCTDIDTLSVLDAFCLKLHSVPVPSVPPPPSSAAIVCKLHGLVKCGSCTAALGRYPESSHNLDPGEGWMRHKLYGEGSPN